LFSRRTLDSLKHLNMIKKFSSTSVTLLAIQTILSLDKKLNILYQLEMVFQAGIVFLLSTFDCYQEVTETKFHFQSLIFNQKFSVFIGTIAHPKILDGTYNGVVVRPLRCINPDQDEYSGLIQLKNENGECISQHKFGITSLTNKRDLLQKDDIVVFKIDEQSRAVEVSFNQYYELILDNNCYGLYLLGNCCS
jgi:hypothetical protein